jgi:FkbM family methyltransferase
MGLMQSIRSWVPKRLKNRLRSSSLRWRIAAALSPHAPGAVCVDVGASFYPHEKWLPFLLSPSTSWVAVEPNVENLGYLDQWVWPCRVRACRLGLSREGGAQTLHVTNVDTGSSLLPPQIPESMQHRVTNLDYFFPVVERRIETATLAQVIDEEADGGPVFVKLDTQGTELSILQGAQSLLESHRIAGIEMEATLLAQPLMRGAGRFWQACEYLEARGYELLDIKPIRAVGRSGREPKGYRTYLNECDAVFALRPDVAAGQPVQCRAGLLVFYVANLLYEEALSVLERDLQVVALLRERGCDEAALSALLRSALK